MIVATICLLLARLIYQHYSSAGRLAQRCFRVTRVQNDSPVANDVR